MASFPEPMKVNLPTLLDQQLEVETDEEVRMALQKQNVALQENLERLKEKNALIRENARLALENAWLLQGNQNLCAPPLSYSGMPVDAVPWHVQTGCAYSEMGMGAVPKKTSKRTKVWNFLRGSTNSSNVRPGSHPSSREGSFGSFGSTNVGGSLGSLNLGDSSLTSITSGHVQQEQDRGASVPCTTMMMRNIPNQYSREMLLDLFVLHGFKTTIDLLYLPMDFQTKNSLGYCFVNFTNEADAERFRVCFSGFSAWALPSEKKACVLLSEVQGIDAHIERYRNSPVMHESVADTYRPVLYKDGERVPFPEPTKAIRAPRLWSRR